MSNQTRVEIQIRIREVRIRRMMMKSAASIMACQLELRIQGLLVAHPSCSMKVAAWLSRLRHERLMQDKDELREIEWDYEEFLRVMRWEEFWYSSYVEGEKVVDEWYERASRSIDCNSRADCSVVPNICGKCSRSQRQ